MEDQGIVEVCAAVTSGTLGIEVTVVLTTQDGSAQGKLVELEKQPLLQHVMTLHSITATLDYEEELVGLLFRSGQDKQCVNITILDDGVLEDQEYFKATLTTVASRVTLNPDRAVVDISDDDSKE